MTRQERVATGAALGLVAYAGRRAWRERRAIDLAGRVVAITGGSRGLGLELARGFTARGAMVALIARDEGALQRAACELAEVPARVFTVAADVRVRDEVERAIQRVVAHFGRLDVLVNNAGIIAVGPLDHMSLDDFEQAMRVHYWGPFYATRAALPHLRRAAGARIVNIASIAGKIAAPHLAAYSGSKSALVGLSDALRAELAAEGIAVTTVCPGLMRTGSPINATFKGRHEDEFTWFSLADSLPVVSVSSQRAARDVIEACRVGAPSLVLGLPARAAVALEALAPGLVAAGAKLAARLMPPPAPAHGDEARLGRESTSRWSPSWLTRRSDRAAARNNQAGPPLQIAAPTTGRR